MVDAEQQVLIDSGEGRLTPLTLLRLLPRFQQFHMSIGRKALLVSKVDFQRMGHHCDQHSAAYDDLSSPFVTLWAGYALLRARAAS